jgi:hypothetical protein
VVQRDSTEKLLSEAREAANRGAFQYSSVCLEAALESTAVDQEMHSEVISIAHELLALPDFMLLAVRQSDAKLVQAMSMMDHFRNLAGEEWVGLISFVSEAVALQRLATRFGIYFDTTKLNQAYDRLGMLTNNFRDLTFQKHLRAARRNGFAPLRDI